MRSKRALILFLALVAFAVGACSLATGPTTVNVTVIVTQTFTLPAAVPSVDPTCPAISKIRVNYPEELDRGAHGPISATPLDSGDNKRDPKCDDKDGVSWTVQPSELIAIASPKSFDTTATAGNTAGSATLSVSVGKSGTNSVPIKVR